VMHVRDLLAEDLQALLPGSPAARIRFLVEAGDALARTGEGDVVAVGDAERMFAAGAAGYDEPFGDAVVVIATACDAIAGTRRLLADLESRSVARRCLGLVSAVDAPDEPVRRLLESLGYEMSGAGVVVWTEETSTGAAERRADVWRLRKTISEGGAGLLPAVERGRGIPGPTPDEEDTCSSD
jgi:hypothetical protein